MYPKELDIRKPKLTHWRTSFRINDLNLVLTKLQELLDWHQQMFENNGWYDETSWDEDREETLGMVFIACQVFIVRSIADSLIRIDKPKLDDKGEDKKRAMKNAPQFKHQRTKIELINAVANYYKHNDEGGTGKETKRILNAYNLLSEEFPINKALELITEDNKVETLALYLCNWRNHLFNTLDNC